MLVPDAAYIVAELGYTAINSGGVPSVPSASRTVTVKLFSYPIQILG